MSSSPQLSVAQPSAREMNRDFVFMIFPLLAVSCYLHGARPAVVCLVAAFTSLLADHFVAWLRRRPYDRTENSSLPAVLVLMMLLPASVSYYVVVVSTLVVVVVGKAAFGGYGHYPFNPTAVGYVVALVSWPDEVLLYPTPFTNMSVFSTENATLVESAAHALRAGGTPSVRAWNLVLGDYAGPMGTTAVLVVIACATYLWMRRDIDVAIPAGFLIACAAVAFFYPRINSLGWALPWEHLYTRFQSVKYELLTGALPFASVFLINEAVTRPRNKRAYFVYGFLTGFMAMMFRYFGTYDTGVCFAVLTVNALSGYLDRIFAPRAHREEAVQ
jgi:electron transport complex protein RnfD